MIIARIIAVVIGYVIGMFQTGYFYGKKNGIDIREHGSGNAGTTNTMRTLGKKAGIITFLGDCFKAVLAVVLVWLLFHGKYPEQIRIIELYAGFGVVLGHNFPAYLKFQGGKGIACTAGVIIAVCLMAGPLCLVLFAGAVLITKYVSVGSILVVCAFLVQTLIFNAFGWLGLSGAGAIEFNIVTACFTLMAIWRHRANIVRLMNGTENKIGQKAK